LVKRVFKPSKKGLYYSDMTHNFSTTLVHTVDINKSRYLIRQYSCAKIVK